jgi:O-antigen/teichoic acid export membrane protein
LILFFLGNKVLLFFGQGYAQHGTALLKLISLSAIPYTVNCFYVNVNRVKKETKKVLISTAAIACLSIGLSYPLMLKQGLYGVGVSWLIGQILVALVVIVLVLLNRQNHSAFVQSKS